MELIGVRLPKELKEKLQAIADEQHRPLSNLVRIIIMEYLKNFDKKPENLKRGPHPPAQEMK